MIHPVIKMSAKSGCRRDRIYRRHCSGFRTGLNSSLFGRPATVMGQGRNVFDHDHFDT
jgi:hypothetical protein